MNKSKNELPDERQSLLGYIREIDAEALRRQQKINLVISLVVFHDEITLLVFLCKDKLIASAITHISHVGNDLTKWFVFVVFAPHIDVSNNY